MDFIQRPSTGHSTRPLFESDVFKDSVSRRAGSRQQSPPGRVRGRTQPRSAALLAAVRRLDAAVDAAASRELSEWIRAEYENELGDLPLGFVAVCYLGPPRIDHRLDLLHSIVEHYAPTDPMPDPFQKSRMMVRTGSYELVEIYASGQVIAVRADGTAVPSGSE